MEPAGAAVGGSALDDCLKLLRGERDEQKLAGLLLATKFCQGDAAATAVRKVYEAVGSRFLRRLLFTGMGKLAGGLKGGEDQEAYLRLSVTVLSAFCRVPEIASSEAMASTVPIIVEVISKSSDSSIIEQGFEFLLLVAGASENGSSMFCKPGVMKMLAPYIANLRDGSSSLELAMQLLQLLVNQMPLNLWNSKDISGFPYMVTSIAALFAVLQNAFKFDALHMLTTLLSSDNPPLHDALRSISTEMWSTQIRIGITAVLQNRMVSTEKVQALLLADSMMAILGENWMIDYNKLQNDQQLLPINKFLLLVLESSRVEVAVLLNEIAYMKYESSKSLSTASETIVEKQKYLATSFSLIEKIIKLISHAYGSEGPIDEGTFRQVIKGLNETIDLVLDFLQDSKDHGQRKGNDLLASVRIIGSYLAETPSACKKKTEDLLGYLLSIEGEDEQRPFYSICFLLPLLCQVTMEIDGRKALASVGGHKMVIECLLNMIRRNRRDEDNDRVFLACDTILNLLINRKDLVDWIQVAQFVDLLHASTLWIENTKDVSVLMMASSICSLVFEMTSEESLLSHFNFHPDTLGKLYQIIAESLNQGEISEEVQEHSDLHQIILAGYREWADRFPRIRDAFEHTLDT